jgi:uncharacterized protein YceK
VKTLLVLLFFSFLSGCSQIRELTMTHDERRLYGSLEATNWCGRQTDRVCIRP